MEADEKLIHYQTLGLSSFSSKGEIKKAYRKLAKKYHPDVNQGGSGAEKRFKDITTAYQELMDAPEAEAEEYFSGEQAKHDGFNNKKNSANNFKQGDNYKNYKTNNSKSDDNYQDYASPHNRQHNMGDFETREQTERARYRGGYHERHNQGVKHGTRDEQVYRERMMKRAAKRNTQRNYKVPAFLRVAMYLFLAIFSGIILMYVAKHGKWGKANKKQVTPYSDGGDVVQEPEYDMAIPDSEDIIGTLQKNIIIDMREKREQAWREEWTDDNIDSPERRMQEKEMERTYSMKKGGEPVTLY